MVQEDSKWELTEEMIVDLKEIFLMFDTDQDGVLTLDQARQAVGVLGIRRSDQQVRNMVAAVSDDQKNLSLEFNEFLKLAALEQKTDATQV